MSYFRAPFSISAAHLQGRKFEGRGFDNVGSAEDYYREIMATLPPGYVITDEDVEPTRSYKVCPKCGGLDTVHNAMSVDGRSLTCRACGYGLLLISNRKDMQHLANKLGVSGWHEPDQQNVTVRFDGDHLDNAGHWPGGFGDRNSRVIEFYVVIEQDGEDVAAVNLATLLAMASTP